MGGSSNMSITSDLPYPKDEYVELFKNFYGEINGPDSFDAVKEWASEQWSAAVNCSRGKVLEKATISRVKLETKHPVTGEDTRFNALQAKVYPLNPKIPVLIFIIEHMTASDEFYSGMMDVIPAVPIEEDLRFLGARPQVRRHQAIL